MSVAPLSANWTTFFAHVKGACQDDELTGKLLFWSLSINRLLANILRAQFDYFLAISPVSYF